MKLLYELEDDQYECSKIDHERLISRAIVLNEKKQVALIHIQGDDIFGHRDYYETPGGGVDKNEKIEDAVVREIEEEVGVKSTIICEIGKVVDFYNLIKRRNINCYYLLKVSGQGVRKLEPFEQAMFQELLWVDIDTAIDLMSKQPDSNVSLLVKRRELPILKIAKEIIFTLQSK